MTDQPQTGTVPGEPQPGQMKKKAEREAAQKDTKTESSSNDAER